jgi:hypothetical protein
MKSWLPAIFHRSFLLALRDLCERSLWITSLAVRAAFWLVSSAVSCAKLLSVPLQLATFIKKKSWPPIMYFLIQILQQHQILSPHWSCHSTSFSCPLYWFIFWLWTRVWKTNKKVKLSPCLINYTLRHESVGWSGCIHPHFLDLSTSLKWVVSFTNRPLYLQGKSPWCPLDRMWKIYKY